MTLGASRSRTTRKVLSASRTRLAWSKKAFSLGMTSGTGDDEMSIGALMKESRNEKGIEVE